MILQSLILMVAGMGTVFVFLIVLIYAVEVTSGIVRRIEAKLDAGKPADPGSGSGSGSGDEKARIAGVIALARVKFGLK